MEFVFGSLIIALGFIFLYIVPKANERRERFEEQKRIANNIARREEERQERRRKEIEKFYAPTRPVNSLPKDKKVYSDNSANSTPYVYATPDTTSYISETYHDSIRHESVTGHGGGFSGAGASGSWDSDSHRHNSSDSHSSYDSSSSSSYDTSSSSSDSGSSGGGD